MTARDDLLARVRKALGGDAGSADPAPIVRGYRSGGTLQRAELLDLLADRLVDYKARVRRCEESALATTIVDVLASRGVQKLVVPTGLADLPLDLELVVDDGSLTPAALDAMDGVLTNATVAIAETGTIVLDGSPDQGRRAITLVPDYHLCVVRADQVVQTVPEAIARLDPQRPQTWISGPSATSDIELNRVEGVHGPRTLEVILVG
ncbi:MAG: L-lactate dehydrogenase complex protein LldG [Frankiales bacterium]|nr:L-lactate dehydrogenase complex protein LldG [Frankiales bacterium]